MQQTARLQFMQWQIRAASLVQCILLPAVPLVFVWSLTVGAVDLSIGQTAAVLCGNIGITLPWEYTARDETVVLALRLPRALLAFAVGAGLGVTGAAMQGMFRNPLVDPALIGVSGGAALGAITVIVLGTQLLPAAGHLMPYAMPVAAFAGGLLATLFASALATRHRMIEVGLLLLAGIAVNAVTAAFSGYLIFIATDAQLRSITFWNLGSVSGATWHTVAITAPAVLLPALLLLRYGRVLNALALGEHEAQYLGINTRLMKITVIIATTIAVGAGVAACGIISFVGLVVPHLIRFVAGPDNRVLLPGSFALGGMLLVLADALARTLAAPAELPLGIVTAGVGGPFFLWLLLRERRGGAL